MAPGLPPTGSLMMGKACRSAACAITLPQAEPRLNAVIAHFNALGGSLGDQRQERDD